MWNINSDLSYIHLHNKYILIYKISFVSTLLYRFGLFDVKNFRSISSTAHPLINTTKSLHGREQFRTSKCFFLGNDKWAATTSYRRPSHKKMYHLEFDIFTNNAYPSGQHYMASVSSPVFPLWVFTKLREVLRQTFLWVLIGYSKNFVEYVIKTKNFRLRMNSIIAIFEMKITKPNLSSLYERFLKYHMRLRIKLNKPIKIY